MTIPHCTLSDMIAANPIAAATRNYLEVMDDGDSDAPQHLIDEAQSRAAGELAVVLTNNVAVDSGEEGPGVNDTCPTCRRTGPARVIVDASLPGYPGVGLCPDTWHVGANGPEVLRAPCSCRSGTFDSCPDHSPRIICPSCLHLAEMHQPEQHDQRSDIMTDQRPTRLIRTRDLTRGAVVLRECIGAPGCSVEADRHRKPGEPIGSVVHELTLLDAEVHDGVLTAIAMTESGEQTKLEQGEYVIARVYADTVAPHPEPKAETA